MKITFKHYAPLVCFLLFIPFFSYGQKTLEGYIFDKISKKPLSYAAIKIAGTGVYTTSNEDGKFEFLLKKNIDSLEIRYLGYETTKVSINYFHSNKIFYLKPFTALLDEVNVNSNRKNTTRNSRKSVADLKDERLYKLLYEIIKKYRNNKKISDSKAYFILNSKAYFPSNPKMDVIPIEQIEGFYNSKQQLSKGILGLNLKAGRFGQNRRFPFYSLNSIFLLQEFNLFSRNSGIFPRHPVNMSLASMKKRYSLTLGQNENYNGTVVSFKPKKEKYDIFSGKIFFQEKDSTIEKIEFVLKDPKSFKLNPIVKSDSVSIKSLKINVLFNPIDLNKIQYYELSLDMVYYSNTDTSTVKSNITSKIILYFYDYDSSFTKPYFTTAIDFDNDYDKLLTLSVSNEVWRQNYPYPQSKKNTEITNFFKNNNQFYSYYENKLPPQSLINVKVSSIIWNHQKRLRSQEIKNGPGINLNFSYALNPYKNKNGNFDFIVKTLFNTKTSFFKAKRTSIELDCINLAFDIYELNRHYLLGRIKESMTLEEVKILSDKAILDARVMTTLMFEESQFGLDNVGFKSWKTKIHARLDKYNKF